MFFSHYILHMVSWVTKYFSVFLSILCHMINFSFKIFSAIDISVFLWSLSMQVTHSEGLFFQIVFGLGLPKIASEVTYMYRISTVSKLYLSCFHRAIFLTYGFEFFVFLIIGKWDPGFSWLKEIVTYMGHLAHTEDTRWFPLEI